MADEHIEFPSFDLQFLKNDSGKPGEEIISVNDIVPTYQNYLGLIGSKHIFDSQPDWPVAITFYQGTY